MTLEHRPAIWTHRYTADAHFGDAGIMRCFGRPFGSAQAMDAAVIEAVAERVKPDDDLRTVGDLARADAYVDLSHAARVFSPLPGRKHLVRGNHDPEAVLAPSWASVHEVAEVDDDGRRVALCHHPLVTWPGARDGALHLFGHVHANWEGCQGR